MARAILRAEYLWIVEPFMDRYDPREVLKGHAVQPHPKGGVFIVGTNGHILCVAHDQEGTTDDAGGKSWLIAPVVLKACKPDRRKIKWAILDSEAGTARIVHADSLDEAKSPDASLFVAGAAGLIDGTFPEWQRVLPIEKPERHEASYSMKLLRAFERAASVSPTNVITISTFDPLGPALVRVGGRTDFFGVIMPLRSSTESGFPSWMKG